MVWRFEIEMGNDRDHSPKLRSPLHLPLDSIVRLLYIYIDPRENFTRDARVAHSET